MKTLILILLTLSLSALANEANQPKCEQSKDCLQEAPIEKTVKKELHTDEEIEQAYTTTEKTLKSIGREIAGEIVTE